MRIGMLTGGGDAPGLNAAIRAVVRAAHEAGHRTSGIRNGWAGALEGRIDELLPRDVRGILPLGGTVLGTSRTNPLKEADGLQRAMGQLTSHGIDAVVAMGGDDTLSIATALHETGYPVVGVPKTIDNDLSATDFCIGFDTAVGIVAEALDRLHTTASAHHRVMVVEVMGRDVGWVATMGGLAGGAIGGVGVGPIGRSGGRGRNGGDGPMYDGAYTVSYGLSQSVRRCAIHSSRQRVYASDPARSCWFAICRLRASSCSTRSS